MNWNERFELAKKYYEHYGHLRVNTSFKTKDGINYDEEGFPLGDWINGQRLQHRIGELTQAHRQKLESIGMIFENINDLDWNNFYQCACIYLEHYRNLIIPRGFRTINGYERDEEGKDLGAWLHFQQMNYNNGTLSPERTEKMKGLYTTLKQYEDLDWLEMYELAKKYYEKYNTLIIRKNSRLILDNGTEINISDLTKWLKKQREEYKSNKLSEERIEMLEKIGMIFGDVLEIKWERMYELAEKYYKHYDNLNVPREFKTKNGVDYDENGSPLGRWLNTQYNNNINGKLSSEKKKRLESIGMIFINQNEEYWNKMLGLATIYLGHHGNLEVPVSFKTTDGINHDEKGNPLGAWLNRQRTNCRKNTLTEEHRQKLEAIGIVFDNFHDINWESMYKLAQAYYNHFANLNIEKAFKTKDGITYDEKGESLGVWIQSQRSDFKSKIMSEYRIKKLQEIGMNFEGVLYTDWEEMYELAKEYYKHYRNLKIETDFKTKDGITYDENGENLYTWVFYQRQKYKNGELSKERIKKLKSIGMIFADIQDFNWERMYGLAKKHYEHYHHLRVKTDFKTKDGINYNKKGENLYSWILYQRQKYKKGELSEERIKKLELIGMIFEIQKDKSKNKEVCTLYGIDYETYKKQVTAIPYREFIAKINYLNNNGISFETEGKLHPIFFMSSINMQVRYGLSLEQMINDHFMELEKAKQKIKVEGL